MRQHLSFFVLLITMLIIYVEAEKNMPPNQIQRKPDIKYIDYIDPFSADNDELILKEVLNPIKRKYFNLELITNFLVGSAIEKLFFKHFDLLESDDLDANLRAIPYKPMVKKTKTRDNKGMIVMSDNSARYKVLPQRY